ncbi:hypothetical protein BT63DRAFT_481040 [Microthyrium microscopicum]|uniref:Uncharacterized protein n=1 Tax=Microthyrium microscopicum TaxID=703497 RepID=A0A6A6U512_9PEZI|nr:hypothetical protein BT63DRAFT_481040 [Microthyrium microscopicum]
MTALVARAPLEPLKMSAAQRTKRKATARVNMEDEDSAPLKKRSRIGGDDGLDDATGQKPLVKPGRKKKKVYDEEKDGFTFRRRNPKRTANETDATSSTSAPPAPDPPESAPEPRRKKAQPQVSPKADSPPKRRRSARLSAENEAPVVEKTAPAPKQRKSRTLERTPPPAQQPVRKEIRREESPRIDDAQNLNIKKSRQNGTTIALPFADTPVIKRNKAMRAAGGRNSSGDRRSSTGLRGRRASSLIDSGTSNGKNTPAEKRKFVDGPATLPKAARPAAQKIYGSGKKRRPSNGVYILLDFSALPPKQDLDANIIISDYVAIPHTEVDVDEFYKLIETGLFEPQRMRHLLIWCSTRALLEKPRGSTDKSTLETIAIESARQIQEELIKDFSSKSQLWDWFDRKDNPGPSLPKKPNPRNITNEAKLKELQDEIEHLEAEEKTWKELLPKSKPVTKPTSEPDSSEINQELLSDSQRAIMSSLKLSTSSNDSTQAISARIQAIAGKLEPTVDAFADGIHRLGTYADTAGQIADRIKGIWAKRLERRDEEAKASSGSADIASRDVLRALAGKLDE